MEERQWGAWVQDEFSVMLNTDQEASAVEILLAEDSPTDAALTRAAFDRELKSYQLHHVEDGDEALAFLRHESPFAGVPTPDIVLLDLKMPRKNGLDTLADIRSDPAIEHIPVIMLTTSAADDDVARAYKLHATCFVTKPIDISQFCEVVRSLGAFAKFVKLPPKSA